MTRQTDPIRVQIVLLTARDGDGAAERALLSAAERARADGFHDPALGRRWAFFRAGLRRCLGARLGMPPQAVPITLAPGGKPCAPGVHFSLSHCGPQGVIALAPVPLGVDIERHDPAPPGVVRLARRILSPPEAVAFEALPPEARPAALIAAWTAKEAAVKALGTGLSTPLREVVPDAAGTGFHSLPGGAAGWRLLRFDPGPGLSGAVVLRATRVNFHTQKQCPEGT